MSQCQKVFHRNTNIETSAPVGVRKRSFPPLVRNYDRQTDQPKHEQPLSLGSFTSNNVYARLYVQCTHAI